MADDSGPNVLDLRFWLEQMGDFARFILAGLPSSEAELLNRGQQFKTLFDGLLERARGTLTEEQLRALNREANRATQDFRRFVLEIMRQIITQQTDIISNLYPEILNHIVNDTELFLTKLAAYMKDSSARVNASQLSLDWLFNLFTICKYIGDTLSLAFFMERARAQVFQTCF